MQRNLCPHAEAYQELGFRTAGPHPPHRVLHAGTALTAAWTTLVNRTVAQRTPDLEVKIMFSFSPGLAPGSL